MGSTTTRTVTETQTLTDTQTVAGGVRTVAGETVTWPPEPLAALSWLYLVVFGSLVAFTAYMVLATQYNSFILSPRRPRKGV